MKLKNQSTGKRNPYTLPLESSACLAPQRVGAKAARLAQLSLHAYPVPKGFVITTDAFKDFCSYHQIDITNKDAIDRPALQQDIINAELPAGLALEIERATESFKYPAYAVRSSCAAEDHAAHSMAGQFETFLRTPKASIPDKIKACWASMFAETVTSYAHKKNLPLSTDMGVIIQEQIEPLYAGVLFTMDPLTKSTDHLIVEWVNGLGDTVASGEANPERLYINRYAPSQNLPSDLPSILQESFETLAAYALKAEALFKGPLDIEWCVTAAGPLLLQARPITGIDGHDWVLWTNVNMVENFPNALTPLSWSFVDAFYKFYTRNMLRLFGWSEKKLFAARSIIDNCTGIQGGRIYYNLSNWYEAAQFLPIGDTLTKLLDSFIGQKVPVHFRSSPSNKWRSKGWRSPLHYLKFWIRLGIVVCRAGHHINKYESAFYHHRKKWRQSPYEELPLHDLLDILDKLFFDFVDRYYFNPAIVDLLSAIFPGSLKRLTDKWLATQFENTELLSVQLMQGVHLKSMAPAEMIQAISKAIAGMPHLQRLLDRAAYADLEKQLSSTLKAQFDEFMLKFGSRCYHDCTMATPTFEERHDLFWDLVKKYQKTNHQPSKRKNEVLERAKIASRRANKHLSFFRRLVFLAVRKNAHRAIRLRERSRIIRSLLFGELRQISLAIGNKLVEKAHLLNAEDVFYLQWTEINAIVYGKYQFPETLQSVIELRKEALEKNNIKDPPSFFLRKRSTYFTDRPGPQSHRLKSSSSLKGVAVSGGKVRATAKIITDPVNDNRLLPGDILVAHATDPGWTPLFQIAGGLILEKGGMLSHGAIVAREFGIPAVAGIENATSIIKDGQRLFMDGDSGEVKIINRTDKPI